MQVKVYLFIYIKELLTLSYNFSLNLKNIPLMFTFAKLGKFKAK